MARPATAPPPPITYDQWRTTGYPQIFISIIDFSKWIPNPVSKMRVYQWRDAGSIVVDEKGRIDTSHPVNREWLIARPDATYVPKPPGRTAAVRANGGSVGEQYDYLGDMERRRTGVAPPPPTTGGNTGEASSDDIDLERILEAIEQMDLSALSGPAIAKIQKLESTLKTRVERMQKRGKLIDRDLVRTVFGKLYQIHTNEVRTLGANLAPGIAGRFGIEDPAAVLEVEKSIDDAALHVLSHIKRLLDDFLVGIGSEVACDV